jgi:hypothetical protein
MRVIWFLSWMGLLAACATPHAARVSCDTKLRPINVRESPDRVANADTAATITTDAVP